MNESQGRPLTRRGMLTALAGAGGLIVANPSTVTSSAAVRGGSLARSVFHVRDFGAIPDDGIDDTEAIRATFAAAKNNAHSIVAFEPGVYLVEGKDPNWQNTRNEGPVSYYSPIFDLNGHRDLSIVGNGAVLQARNWAVIFLVSEVEGLEFRDLTIDWERDLPQTEGIVVADTPEYVDVEVNEGFSVRDGLHVTGLIHFDVANHRFEQPWIFNRANREPQPAEPVSESVLRCFKHPFFADVEFPVDDGIVVKHTEAGGPAFVIVTSSDVLLSNIAILAAPGQGVLASDVHNIHMVNSKIAPPAGRWMSISRGATNFSHTSGDVLISNTEIFHQGDDAYNYHGFYYLGHVQPDGRAVVIHEPSDGNLYGFFEESHRYAPFYVGDTIEISLPSTSLVTLGASELVAVHKSAAANINTYELTFADDLPADVRDAGEAAIFNISRMPDHAEFSNNRVGRSTGGGRIHADHTVVRDNEFISTIGLPVSLEPGWRASSEAVVWTGRNARHIMISNNLFHDCAYARRAADRFGVIEFQTFRVPDSPAGTFDDFQIRNNEFVKVTNPGGQFVPAIRLNSASNIEIRNNMYQGYPLDKQVVLGQNNDCSSITVDGQPTC